MASRPPCAWLRTLVRRSCAERVRTGLRKPRNPALGARSPMIGHGMGNASSMIQQPCNRSWHARGRRWRWVSRALLAALVLPLGLAAAPDCRRVEIRAAGTGHPIVGAEDLAIDRSGRRVYIAAFDRWALEDALSADAARLPQGAIYSVAFEQLRERPAVLRATRVADGGAADFHPHGIALYQGPGQPRLYAINHAHEREANEWQRKTRIEAFRARGDGRLQHLAGKHHERLCRANDLVALGPTDLLITRDHGACGGPMLWMEQLLGLRRAQIVRAQTPPPWSDPENGLDITVLADDIGLANGITLEAGGERVAVSATREERVRIYRTRELLNATDPAPERSLPVPGGPDNLTWTHAGLFAALHPSLLDMGMARHRWFGVRRAGTRVVRLEPSTGVLESLIDDPDAAQLNAGTTPALFDGVLVVGSVLDNALLVCRTRQKGDAGAD